LSALKGDRPAPGRQLTAVETLHQLNLATHIAAGTCALALGLALLARQKGTAWHRRVGRWYAALAGVVAVTAVIGMTVFRFLPLFVVLTLLTTALLLSGWRDAIRKAARPSWVDGLGTVLTLALAIALVPVLTAANHTGSSQPVVVRSTLGALGVVLAWDSARFFFPVRWHASLWLPAHVYKLVSSLSAMASALLGNTWRAGQPWSQIAPSVMGSLVIIWFVVRIARQGASARSVTS
jgi:uncharacterized membrane protein